MPGLGRSHPCGAAHPRATATGPRAAMCAPTASAARAAHSTRQQAQLATTRGSLCAMTEDPAQPERREL